jgi:endonuclease/exonuclease/phosphatase family metal-dependent hydrolase
MEDMLM